jgi:hydrogenase maturation protease
MNHPILIAGVGNIFLGDDAFGVEVVRALAARTLPAGVSVVDYGIRGFDLAFALLEPWDAVIIVDALARGGSAGTLYTLEPDLSSMQGSDTPEMMNPHGMDPVHVLRLALSMGVVSARIYVVGCEPMDFGDELEGRMGLSESVQAVIDSAVEMIASLIRGIHAASSNLLDTELLTR